MIYIVVISIILFYVVDTFLIGVTYHALKIRFRWNISAKKSFLILFIAFAILDNYILPFLFALDLRFTIGNETIAKFIDTHGTIHALELFDPGIFDFFVYISQALLAGIIGPKILNEKGDNITSR
jgi:hypothetical protein